MFVVKLAAFFEKPPLAAGPRLTLSKSGVWLRRGGGRVRLRARCLVGSARRRAVNDESPVGRKS